jgi:hypothetical protein
MNMARNRLEELGGAFCTKSPPYSWIPLSAEKRLKSDQNDNGEARRSSQESGNESHSP